MRRAQQLGIVALAGAGLIGGFWFVAHPADLLRDAQINLAHGDLHAAELELGSFLRGHPHNPEASFRLGIVDLAQSRGVSAERNFRVALDGGFDPAAIVIPLGQAYMLQQHFDAALADFAPDRAPPRAVAQTFAVRALAYLGLRRLPEARAAIARATQIAPDNPDIGLTQARIDFASADLDAAARAVAQVAGRDPQRPDALLMQADIVLAQGDAAASLALARRVQAERPNDIGARITAARALILLQRDDEAGTLLEQVGRAAPQRVDMHYLRAIVAVRRRNYTEADVQLAAISPVLDRLPLGNYLLGTTKLALDQPAQAQEAAASYALHNPADTAGGKLLALTELRLGHPDRALQALQPAMGGGTPDADMLGLRGRALAMLGHFQAAAAIWAQAAALAPRDTALLNRLAAARLQTGDNLAGAAALRQSLAVVPDQPRAASALVQASLDAGDLQGATDAVARLRAADGDIEPVGVLTGQIKIASLDTAGARDAFRAVLRQFPDSRGATFGLNQIDLMSGADAAAHDRLTAWMAAHPTDERGLGLAIGQAMQAGDAKGAIALAEAAHAAAPAEPAFTKILARLYLRTGQPERAVAMLSRAASTNDATNETTLVTLQAEAQAGNGHPEEARRLFLQAADADPKDPAPRLGLIGLALQANDFSAARAAVADGLIINPGNPTLLAAAVAIEKRAGGLPAALARAASLRADRQNLPAALPLAADLLAASGDRKGAAAAYLDAFREAPSSGLAVGAALALARASRPADATALLAQWTGAHPDDVPALQVLASLAIAAHRLDDAGGWLAKILYVQPDNPVALNNAAWVKLSEGDLAAAHALAQRAYIIAPGPETQDTLGWTVARQGDTATALPLLQQAAAHDPDQTVLYHEAFALNAAGRADTARAALDRALGDPRDFDDRAAALRLRTTLGP